MTRRLLAVLVTALLAACTRVGTSESPAAGNPWTHHGLLRMVDISEPDNLNPLIGNQQIDSDLAMLWGGFFFNWSDTNQFVPELATELPTLANHGISPDGKTIRYHLRPNVTWQDGAPFTADDVIFTWHAIMNKKNNITSTVGFDLIAAIDEPDPHTIVVHLKSVWAPFVATFFSQSGTPFPVLPAHLLARYDTINRVPYNSQPIGTGPFTMEHWQRGSKIVFRANPHYWRGPPKLREIWYTPVPSSSTIETLLASHEADLDFYASPTQYKQFTQIPGVKVVLTPFGVDPDDSTLLMCDQFPPQGQNSMRFCDPELDAAERVALGSNDRVVRKRAYDRIQAIVADQVPVIYNWYVRRIAVANTDLKNYRPAHAVTSFWNPWEWEI